MMIQHEINEIFIHGYKACEFGYSNGLNDSPEVKTILSKCSKGPSIYFVRTEGGGPSE